MIFRRDAVTGAIDEITSDDAREALRRAGWTQWSIDNFFLSRTKVLWTRFFDFCGSRFHLEEFAEGK
jgi:hypothetical protein